MPSAYFKEVNPVTSASISTLSVVDLVPFGYGGLDARFYALRLSMPGWKTWRPGQFVMLRPSSWGLESPWSKPFSICLISRQDLVIFLQVVGRGTDRIGALKPGDTVQVLGPLGNGFAVEPETPTLLLAGGMGIAPFVGYAMNHPTPWSLHLDFGHRMPAECYPFENFNEKIVAENYRESKPGDREDFLRTIENHLADNARQKGLVLACGPKPFLRAVQEMSLRHGARTQLSTENRMACGVGACLGCVVKPLLGADGKNVSKNPIIKELESGLPVPSCTCGPVFWADSIDLSEG